MIEKKGFNGKRTSVILTILSFSILLLILLIHMTSSSPPKYLDGKVKEFEAFLHSRQETFSNTESNVLDDYFTVYHQLMYGDLSFSLIDLKQNKIDHLSFNPISDQVVNIKPRQFAIINTSDYRRPKLIVLADINEKVHTLVFDIDSDEITAFISTDAKTEDWKTDGSFLVADSDGYITYYHLGTKENSYVPIKGLNHKVIKVQDNRYQAEFFISALKVEKSFYLKELSKQDEKENVEWFNFNGDNDSNDSYIISKKFDNLDTKIVSNDHRYSLSIKTTTSSATYMLPCGLGRIDDYFITQIYNSYTLSIVTSNENQFIVDNYLLIGQRFEPFRVSSWRDSYEGVSINQHRVFFDKEVVSKICSGPTGILYRAISDGTPLFSVISSYDYYDSDYDYKEEVMLCPFSSEDYCKKHFYTGYYDALDIDWWGMEPSDNFPKAIESTLLRNIHKIEKEPWKNYFSSPDYRIYHVTKGDLNSDGLTDYGIVIEYLSGFTSFERQLYVMISINESDFKVIKDGNRTVMGSMEGGVFGNPFEGIDFGDKELLIHHYGGSSDRWGYEAVYQWDGNNLGLSSIELTGYSTHTLTGRRDRYDFTNKTVSQYSWSCDENYDGLLLNHYDISYETPVKISTLLEYDIYSSLWSDYNYRGTDASMPSIYRIVHGGDEITESIKLLPSEVLRKYVNENFPEAESVELPFKQEFISNYEILLGYEIPKVYFTDGEYSIWYDGLNPLFSKDDRVAYQLVVRDLVSEKNEHIFLYLDELGNIIND